MINTREEFLHKGRDLINRRDWVAMNEHEIAALLNIHLDAFIGLFKTKWHFEGDILDDYAGQHLLYSKTKLSCWFQTHARKVKRYNLYLIHEFLSYPYLLKVLFSSLDKQEVTFHSKASENFIQQLTIMFAKCFGEQNQNASQLETGLNQSKESIREFAEKLTGMDREELADKYLEIENSK